MGAYYVIGDGVEQNYLDHIGRRVDMHPLMPAQFNTMLRIAVCTATTLQTISVQPLYIAQIYIIAEQCMGITDDWPMAQRIWRLLFMGLTFLICVVFRHEIAYALGVYGSLFDAFFSLIVPCAAMLWLAWSDLCLTAKMSLIAFLSAACCYGAVGSYLSLHELVAGLNGGGNK